jgi:branched-chain amino acid aminotransferase
MTHIWRNGQWTEAEVLEIAPRDRGLLHGLGLFETLLAIDGRAVFADRHLARLQASCKRLGWNPEVPDITGPVSSHGRGRVRIRLTLTGGSGPLHDLSHGADHLWMLAASPVAEAPAPTSVNVSPFTRNEHSPLAGLKCASYAENLVALDHAGRLGFGETLFFNKAGHLCEAATANVFLVKEGTLRTPALDCGCLPGITRAVVIGLAARLGIPCMETRLTTDDLHSADGMFLTSSIRGVTGVTRLEQRTLPPCAVTATLRRAWDEAVHDESGKNMGACIGESGGQF